MGVQSKSQFVAWLTSELESAKSIYLTDFMGINSKDMTELRRRLSDVSVKYLVVKNTLMLRAVQKAKLDELSKFLEGPTAIAVSNNDEVAPAKVLVDFARENQVEKPKIKVGLIGGKILSSDQVVGLAKLPSKEILLGQLILSIQSPIYNLTNTLNGVTRNLVFTLNAYKNKREKEEISK